MHNLGQLSPLLRPIVLMMVLQSASFGQCVPFSEARDHIGATRCITGKVIRVQQGNGGVHFFDFCEDFRVCPFTVVVFPSDPKQVGDIRRLAGRQIEIEGEVKGYDGRAEIVLKRISQLRGDAAKIPPLPKEYDVERHGNYSAGKFHTPKATKQPTHKRQSAPVSIEDPSQPMSPTD
jgi:hypothetical protein